MRVNIITCIIIALSMLICPLAANTNGKEEPEDSSVTEEINEKGGNTVSVMMSQTGKVSEIGMKEYVVGCVAAEMPSLYHTEALKAQAVACYTYAKRIRENGGIDGADITDNSDNHQGYIDKESRRKKWGENFDEYESKITAAVESVLGEYMVCEGETVLAVYHATSAGRTRSAEELWGESFPYLISVESPGDKLSPDYIGTKTFSEEELKKVFEDSGVEVTGDAEKWIGKISRDGSGYVTSVSVCGNEISASDFRNAADLRSTCFDIDYGKGSFTVTCKGYGHGAGMSQYGADYMARQGFDYKEILAHYYTGVNFEKE